MGKIFLISTLATFFAFVVDVSVPTSTLEGRYSTIDEAKLEAFTKIGEKYYYLVDTNPSLSWFGAANFCRRMDAHLATIESEKEWQALSSHLISKGYTNKVAFWLSGNCLENLKDYYWSSNGQRMYYSKWSPGEPSNTGKNEHCSMLWRQGNEFTMNDGPCNNKMLYICEVASPKTVTINIW